MNTIPLLKRFQFEIYVLAPFGLLIFLLAFIYGCQQKKAPPKDEGPVVTLENLQTAYAKAVQYRHMYSNFVPQAEKEHFKQAANLYRAIAQSEGIHAQLHSALLKEFGKEPQEPPLDSMTVGTTLQTIKMATSSEDIEATSMYPNLIRTAESEKCTKAFEQFSFVKDADARHGELLKELQDKNGKIAVVPYFVCPGCGYILTSKATDECPTCHKKKDSFITI